MKIKRIVNGQEMEFELTDEEVGKAYMEWQNMIDIEEIELYALNEFERDPDLFMEEFGRDISLAREHMDEIVAEFHERYECSVIDDDAKQEAIIDAIFAVLDDYKKEEES